MPSNDLINTSIVVLLLVNQRLVHLFLKHQFSYQKQASKPQIRAKLIADLKWYKSYGLSDPRLRSGVLLVKPG